MGATVRNQLTLFDQLLSENPYRREREAQRLSQARLAGILEVSVQYIYRHENGLIGTPSWSLGEVLGDPGRLEEEYYAWRDGIRQRVARTIRHLDIPISGDPEHPFRLVMSQICAQAMPALGIEGDIHSQQMFNRLMCLHPRSVQLYLRGKKYLMNDALRQAMVQVVGEYWTGSVEEAMRVWHGIQ